MAFLAVLRARRTARQHQRQPGRAALRPRRTEALPPVWKERALERLAGRLVDGVVTVRASEHRSQWRNRETAAVRLAALLAEATAPPPKPRRATRIPAGINERRLREKKQRSDVKRGRTGRGWT